MLVLLAAALVPGVAHGESASSQVRSYQAGMIDSGYQHSCAVLGTGTAACWGDDAFGQLGNGAPTTDQGSPSPVAISPPRRAVSISAGWEHTCSVLDDGSAACWGSDTAGRLGNGATAGVQQAPSLVALPAGRRAVTISAGYEHTCATLDDGSAVCWGSDADGRLGNGSVVTGAQAEPSAVILPTGRRAVAISAGIFTSCALLDNGELFCWGDGFYDGVAGGADQPTPAAVLLPPGRRAVAVSAGDFASCVLLDDGAVRCWGLDLHGEVGNGSPFGAVSTPAAVLLPAGTQALAVAAGRAHSCAIMAGGAVSCWGLDQAGQLGDGGTFSDPDQPSPIGVALPFGRQAVALGAGGDNSCALVDDGSLWCWGLDDNSQVGDGPTIANQFSPASVFLPLTFPGRIADVSVLVDGVPATLTVGQPGGVAVRVVNGGADTVTGLTVALSPSQVGLSGGVTSQGSLAAAIWQVGELDPGGQALLTLHLTASAPGSTSLGAQLMTADVLDPDSTPGNSVATEDDQALITIPAVAAPVSPPPAPAPPPPLKAVPDRLTVALANARDRTAPHVFVVRGRLVASKVAAALGCRGQVTVTAAAGKRVLVRRRVPLRLVDGACEYKATLTVSKKVRRTAKSVRVTVSFAGNDALLARNSAARVARLT